MRLSSSHCWDLVNELDVDMPPGPGGGCSLSPFYPAVSAAGVLSRGVSNCSSKSGLCRGSKPYTCQSIVLPDDGLSWHTDGYTSAGRDEWRAGMIVLPSATTWTSSSPVHLVHRFQLPSMAPRFHSAPYVQPAIADMQQLRCCIDWATISGGIRVPGGRTSCASSCRSRRTDFV